MQRHAHLLLLALVAACGSVVSPTVDGPPGGAATLTVQPGGNGTGTVTSSPAGIDCGATCSTSVDPGTTVTLTASPDPGSTFVGWTGGNCSGTGACVVTVDADVTVQAAFALNNSLVVTLGGTGTGTVTSSPTGIDCGTTCSAQFSPGTVVTLTATPSGSSVFSGWSGGGCGGTGTCVVTVNAAIGVTAIFTLPQYTLTVTPAGTGGGTVTSSPAGIDCPGTCAAAFDYNATVTLTASPNGSSVFAGWSGGGCSGAGACVVTMSASTTVTATFTASGTPPILQWALDGNGNNTGSTGGYALTLNGSTSYVAGKFGQAAQFNAGSYGVVAGSARAVLGAYAQYTISFWVNASSSPNTNNAFVDFGNRSAAPYGGIQLAYFTASQYSICVSTTTNSYLGGSCAIFNAPAGNSWHNVILRYAGTGTGAGQGAGVDIYEDGALVKTIANDANNNPVFSSGILDTLYLGTGGITLDDIRVYNTTFTPANQCTQVIGGTWSGTTCTLP